MRSFEKSIRKKTREPEIEALVVGYKAGDHAATESLLAYIHSIIKQVIRTKRYNRHAEQIEDLEQECWVNAIKNIPRWRPERGTLKNFFFQCFSNEMQIFLYRRQAVHREGLVVENTQDSPAYSEGLEAAPIFSDELSAYLAIRFMEAREAYVLQKVCTAIYLKIFDGMRAKMVKDLKAITGLNSRRIKFLVDYSLVVVRLYGLTLEVKHEDRL